MLNASPCLSKGDGSEVIVVNALASKFVKIASAACTKRARTE
jgi:hypothetical protein